MTDAIPFDRTPPEPGRVATLTPLVRRIVAANPGPFTFTGTCTYLVGRGRVAVIDPGPDDPAHLAAILAALDGERVEAILVTHTHRDHSPGAAALRAATGAPTCGEGPHRAARPLLESAVPLDASGDLAFRPDITLTDGTAVEGPDWTLTAVATPGHCANHLCFALAQEGSLFSGDHVMAWSTSIVAPPDGAMGDYLISLARLLDREDRLYWPGHGAPVAEPRRFVRALIGHRRQREAAVLAALAAAPATIAALVETVYAGLDPTLRPAAALNTLSLIDHLVECGAVSILRGSGLDAVYAAA